MTQAVKHLLSHGNQMQIIQNQMYERALQNYQQVFDFIRRTSSLRFRKRSERHIERSGAKSKYFPVFQSPL